jgi:lysophospholipase L1-like esterase
MRRPILAVAALLVTACSGSRPDHRVLPHDRDAPLLYVALGDSTVEGVGASSVEANYVSRLHARLAAIYPATEVVNLGAGGATAAEVVARQLPRAVELRPDVVTLSVGPNDITTRVAEEQYARDLDTILGTLAERTRAVVVINLIPDLAATPRFRHDPAREIVGRRTARFNEVLRKLARARGMPLVDLYSTSRVEVPAHPDLVAADGYHPSDAGYARWAELMWAGLRPRVGAAAVPK